MAEVPDTDFACGFCDSPLDLADAFLHRAVPYGQPNRPGREDQWLCGFCRHSLVVSAWLAGTPGDFHLARDMMRGLNILRAEIRELAAREEEA